MIVPEIIRRQYGDFPQGQILNFLHDILITEAGVSFEYDNFVSWRMQPEIFGVGVDIAFPRLELDIKDREDTSNFNIQKAHIVLDGEISLEIAAVSPGIIVPYSSYDVMFLDALRVAYPNHPHDRCNRDLARTAFIPESLKPSWTGDQDAEPADPDQEEGDMRIIDKRVVGLQSQLAS